MADNPLAPRAALGAFLLLATLAGVAFGPSLGGGFLNWDDPTYVVHNAELRQPVPEALGTIFGTFHFTNYNPLHRLSLLIDFKLFGLEAVPSWARYLATAISPSFPVLCRPSSLSPYSPRCPSRPAWNSTAIRIAVSISSADR